MARLAFRRRSISEDTYIRETKMAAAAAAASSDNNCGRLLDPSDSGPDTSAGHQRHGDGVICSNEDLKAIVSLHKLRRSPAVSPTATQPVSIASQATTALQLSVSDDVIVHVTSPCSGGGSPSRIDSSQVASDQASITAAAAAVAAASDVLDTEVEEVQVIEPTTSSNPSVTVASSKTDDDVLSKQDCIKNLESSAVSVTVVDAEGKKACCTVREVVYDEHGQTWDVYGADFDPEILGQAIQAYLEKIMKKKMERAGQSNSRDSAGSGITSDPDVQGSRDSRLCEPTGGRQGQRQIDRAIGFVMRYLCSSVWRQQRATPTKS
jgi:hypothetical protein